MFTHIDPSVLAEHGSAMQETITTLKQQLEAKAQDNMPPPPVDLNFLDDGPESAQSAAARENREALTRARSLQAQAGYFRTCSRVLAAF